MAHAVAESGESAGGASRLAAQQRHCQVQVRRPSARSFPSSLGEAGLCSVKVFT